MNRFTTLIVILLAALIAQTACIAGAAKAPDPNPQQRAWRLIDDGALLIDVRSRQLYEAGHLDKAVNVAADSVEELAQTIGEDTEREVVVYCQDGADAEKARQELNLKGYQNVHNASGYKAMQDAREKY